MSVVPVPWFINKAEEAGRAERSRAEGGRECARWCMCVKRVEEQISVQPPTSCSGGGARSELFMARVGPAASGFRKTEASDWRGLRGALQSRAGAGSARGKEVKERRKCKRVSGQVSEL